MSSFFYLLGLGFLLASIASCTTSAVPLAGYANMIAWILCWVGGAIVERLPKPSESPSLSWDLKALWSGTGSPAPMPVMVTQNEKIEMQRYGIIWRAGEFWINGEHYLRVGDAIARGRELHPD